MKAPGGGTAAANGSECVKAKRRRTVTAVVMVILVVGAGLWIGRVAWTRYVKSQGPVAPATAAAAPAPAPARGPAAAGRAKPVTRPATRPVPTPPPPTSQPPLGGNLTLQEGLKLQQAGKLLEARRVLSALIFSGTLSEAEAEQARAAATSLAEQTLLSPQFYEGDPYAFQYTFVTGDTLNRVERDLKLHVPAQLILNINGLGHGSAIRAGQSVKMIQGPFHAIVSKGNFTLDLYLQHEGLEKVFIKRVKVGLGADGSTPVGSWKVGLGKKMLNATWFPPPSSPIHQPQHPGDPNYPLGRSGYWIGLVGTDPNTAPCNGYGLHGTNDPTSIGRAASLGCIRLADVDIELVFSLLYEEWSTVQVAP